MDVVEFLHARIAEEEAKAQIEHFPWAGTPTDLTYSGSLGARMRAECAMKRYILAVLQKGAEAQGSRVSPGGASYRSMLRILAAAYVNHPDFRSEWLDFQ